MKWREICPDITIPTTVVAADPATTAVTDPTM